MIASDIIWTYSPTKQIADVKIKIGEVTSNVIFVIANKISINDGNNIGERAPVLYTCSGVCIGCQVWATFNAQGELTGVGCTCVPGCLLFKDGVQQGNGY